MQQEELFTRVNDSIRKLAATNDPEALTWQFICECSDLACHTFVTLTVSEFDLRRAASPPLPVIASDHAALLQSPAA